MSQNFVNPENTQGRPDPEYAELIKKIQQDGVCPFCPEHFSTYHKKPILYETPYWLLTENMKPYEGARVQLLIIYKFHAVSILEICNESWLSLRRVIERAHLMYDIPGGTLVFRFGDTKYTGASVAHLHCNLVSSDPLSKNYKPVIARVG